MIMLDEKARAGIDFRLIGMGANPLVSGLDADRGGLADTLTPKRAAIDAVRGRFREAAAYSRPIASLTDRSV